MQHYTSNAQKFFTETAALDLSGLRQRFLQTLPNTKPLRILDAGCGSGRDAKAFAQAGHLVSAFDASPELVTLAREYSQVAVYQSTFEELRLAPTETFDGIWCCASLLHVLPENLPAVLHHLWAHLNPGGTLYTCFKRGSGVREEPTRRFTDTTIPQLLHWLDLAEVTDVSSAQHWTTSDVRPHRTEYWINSLISKKTTRNP